MEITYVNQKKFTWHTNIVLRWDSSGVYIWISVVNDLVHGNYICKSEENLPDIRTSYGDSSGVYIYKSIVNDLRHGNYICKSEENLPAHILPTPEAESWV